MRTISTGEPSTLATYLKIAKIIGAPGAPEFLEAKGAEDPDGMNAEVIADERQMLYLLTNGNFKENTND